MRALVFGAGGFNGGNIVAELAGSGHEVSPVYHSLAGRDGYAADMTDYDAVRSVIEAAEPEAMINSAGSMPTNGREPQYEVGTRTILTALRDSKVSLLGNVIVFGSSIVYGQPDALPVAESAPLKPQGIYGEAKYAEEMTARNLGNEYGLPVVIARPFNMVGPGMPKNNMLPQVVDRVQRHIDVGDELLINVRQLNARRDYSPVRDTAGAVALLATMPDLPYDTYNIGSGRQTSNRELVRMVLHSFGLGNISPEDVTPEPKPRYEDLPLYASLADITRLEELSWRPQSTLQEAIDATVSEAAAQTAQVA